MRALVLKSHHEPTASQAWLVNRALGCAAGEEIACGGVTLNRAVGGLNPLAVETLAALGGRVVWLPTFSAAHCLRLMGQPDGAGISVLDGQDRLTGEALDVLDAVAAAGLALATGHLGPRESAVLVPEARRRGVRAVVVTHPESHLVDMTLPLQRELAALQGVFFERCRMSGEGTAPGSTGAAPAVDRLAAAIREVGVETTVLSTDYGQPANPTPVAGFASYLDELGERGFTPSELDRMARRNPAAVLGL